MGTAYSPLYGKNWDNPDRIERTTCLLCGGPRDLEHQSSWRHQEADRWYRDTVARNNPEARRAEAQAAGWITNY